MLARLLRIFHRYADRTLVLEGEVPAPTEQVQVQRAAFVAGRYIVDGRSTADRVGLTLGEAEHWAHPIEGGFALDVPFGPGQPKLKLGGDVVSLPAFDPARLSRGRRALLPGFVWALVTLLPVIWRWKLRGDLGAREVVKERLNLVPPSGAVEMRADIFAPVTRPPALPASVTIVLPVFNALDLLQEALSRLEAHTDMPWRLVLIEDASTDANVRPWLRDWAQARSDRVTLLENATNLGFVGSVNRGFEAARVWPDAPVVLLNSDAMLPAGWPSRLLAPLADKTVASVTPMSNDAEIFTIPAIVARHDLRDSEGDALDRVAAGLHPMHGLAEAPTGVGYCMALSPHFLAQVPQFDVAFGRGYGEETDWCQKTRALGGRHVGTPALFVEHRGGVSFGSVEKQRLLQRNGAIISKRYPGYDQEVQDFIAADPLVASRLALGLTLAGLRQKGPVPIYLAHAMGGGAENWLQARINADLAQGLASVVLRVGQGVRWQLALHMPQGAVRGLTGDVGLIHQLLACLPERRVVYSCGVGDPHPLDLPQLLLEIAGRGAEALKGGPQPVEVLFHDFFPISPSYTLLGNNSVYSGVPKPDTPMAQDPAHLAMGDDLAQWQDAWGALVNAADQITVFSKASRRIVTEVWPDSAARVVVRPHALPQEVPALSAASSGSGRPVIGVLGNIGLHKGAEVLQALSVDLARSEEADLVVIGDVAPEFTLKSPAVVHGSYKLRDLPGLVARYDITCWFIPSIWPETFSFTTHEALATGLPVFAFDLGAQGDAVREAKNGSVIALNAPMTADTFRTRLDAEGEL